MKGFLTKVGMGAALFATALSAAAPAEAQRWGGYRHRDRGGDVAAGALLGGIVGLGVGAAIAGSNRDRYYDRGYYYDAPPRVVYRERYYAPPPPPVIYRERVYPSPYYRGYYPRGYDGYYGY